MWKKIIRSFLMSDAYKKLPKTLRACPLCGSHEHRVVCKNDRNFLGLMTVCCQRCHFCFTNPYPDQQSLDKYYSDIYRQTVKSELVPDLHSPEARARSQRTSYYVDLLSLHSSTNLSYLDIGCGDGGLAEAVSQAYPHAAIHLVEKNQAFLRMAELRSGGRGFDSLEALFSHSIPFSTISLIHVLEHFVNPQVVLRQIHRLANPATLIFIDVPDAEAYSSLSDIHFSHPSHFSLQTLRSLLMICGFEPVAEYRHSPPIFPKSIWMVCRPKDSLVATINFQHDDYAQVFGRIDQPLKFLAWRSGLIRSSHRDE